MVGDQISSHEAPDLAARRHDVDHRHVTKVGIVGIVEPVLSDADFPGVVTYCSCLQAEKQVERRSRDKKVEADEEAKSFHFGGMDIPRGLLVSSCS